MRTLQSQIGWCGRAQWMTGAVMMGVLVGFLAFGFRPLNRRLGELRSRLDQRQEHLVACQSRARALPIVEFEVEKLRLKLQRFDKKLPRQKEMGQFIREVTQLSGQSALRRVTVQPGLPRKTDLFVEQPILLDFEGDFANVYAFLRQTEDMQRLTRVKNMVVRTKDSKLGQVEVQMTMSIYFTEG